MSGAPTSSPAVDSAPPIDRATAGPLARWSLSDVLRLGGGAALVLALVQYLLVGIDAQDDLQRFALLLAQTGTFTGGAFLLQRVFSDARSARLLIGVALLSVVAGFTVLGAMLYASVPLDGDAFLGSSGLLRSAYTDSGYPDYARWQAAGAAQLGIAALGAAIVLVPTTRFAFAVLARGVATRLTATTLLASLVLLVPLRDPALVGVLVAASWLAVRYAHRGLRARDPALATVEGRIALALPYLPATIVAARALLMYAPDALFALPIALAVWGLMRWRARSLSGGRYALGGAAIVATALIVGYLLEATLDLYALPAITTFAAIGLADLRRHARVGRGVRVFDSTALLMALVPLSISLMLNHLDDHATLLPIVATLPLLAYALHTGRHWTSAAILLCLLWQTVSVAEMLIALLSHHGWKSLLVVGLIAVTGAAWLDRLGGVPALLRRSRPDTGAAVTPGSDVLAGTRAPTGSSSTEPNAAPRVTGIAA